jgi:hypothetical protein
MRNKIQRSTWRETRKSRRMWKWWSRRGIRFVHLVTALKCWPWNQWGRGSILPHTEARNRLRFVKPSAKYYILKKSMAFSGFQTHCDLSSAIIALFVCHSSSYLSLFPPHTTCIAHAVLRCYAYSKWKFNQYVNRCWYKLRERRGGDGTGRVRGEDLGLGGGMVKRAAGKRFGGGGGEMKQRTCSFIYNSHTHTITFPPSPPTITLASSIVSFLEKKKILRLAPNVSTST